jgi:transposase-like protein
MTKEPKRQKALEERRAIVEDYMKSGKSLKEYVQGREFSIETLRRWLIGHKRGKAEKEEG